MTPPTVLVVDDDPAVRRSLARLLRSAGLTVQSFVSAQDFLSRGTIVGAACLVLDLRMPGMTGLELQTDMERRGLNIPIIFMTGHGDVASCAAAMKAGALEFLEKPFDETQLLGAIQRAIAQHGRDETERSEREAIHARLARLTPREYEVLTYVITGMLNKQIAARLGTSEKTIKVHRSRVMEKMEVQSVAELVRLADKLDLQGPSGSSPEAGPEA
jgi:RNA polymerase sigma factor (sigma-70 family)